MLLPQRQPQRSSALEATAAGPGLSAASRLLLAALGVPAAYADQGLVGAGKRGSVHGATAAGAADSASSAAASHPSLVVKLQPADGRVTQELCGGLLVAAAAHARSAAGSGGELGMAGGPPPLALPVAWGAAAGGADSWVALPYAGPFTLEQAVLGHGGRVSTSARRPLSLAAAIPLLRRLLGALAQLHGTAAASGGGGAVFLDLHPGNVVLPDATGSVAAAGRAVVVDLGSVQPLAGTAGAAASSYTGGTRGGRWDFMPPEQFGPDPPYATGVVTLTAAADVFAAASTVLFALTGEAPFAPAPATGFGGGGSAKLTVAGTRGHPLRASRDRLREYVEAATASASSRGDEAAAGPASAPATAAAHVASVLLTALETDPAARFPDATAMLRALG